MQIDIKRFILGPLATNCYLLSNLQKESIIVDPPIYDDGLTSHIETNNLNPVLIINTHGHIDHIYGNQDYKELYGIPLAIHKNDVELLKYNWNDFTVSYPPDYQPSEPEVILEDGERIEFGDEHLDIIHTPGHSPGSICISINDRVLTGDTLFKGGIGRYDLPGGSEESLMESIRTRLLTLPDETMLYPGHGEKTSIRYEKDNNPFF